MRRYSAIVASVLVSYLCIAGLESLAAEPLRVFIRAGVKTHGPGQHDHPRFLKDWTTLLKARGIRADGGMAFPTTEQLAGTDVLVIYAADGMKIEGEERTRFESFLQRGGGVVVIHDGVVSGDQHDWAKRVQGGAWRWDGDPRTKWHEGEVGVYVVDLEHPITRGLSNFQWSDEIYFDMDMAPDAKVLATSFENVFSIAPQLWTYERTWDGGSRPYRVFVSLPGHEYRSFETPHYRTILLRGIAWAGRRDDVDEFSRAEELASLRYPEGGPTAPAQAADRLEVHPEFDVRLVASEPLVEKVISIDWDSAGRLWVAETPEYPAGRTIHGNDRLIAAWSRRLPADAKTEGKEDRPARDRISRLEDSDGDGVMDKKHVFHDGLELVTSLVFYRDGVIVAQAPDILWLRDTDDDGRADRVEILYTGFGTFDTHAVLSNMRWGMDGWIYSAIGYSAGNPVSPDGAIRFGRVTAGVIRFKPDGSAVEQVAAGSCNTWGFDFAPDGEAFYTTATCGEHLLHVVLPESAIVRGSTGDVRASAVLPDHQKVFPAVVRSESPYRQIDWVGMFTAASGSCVYNGGAWPDRYTGTHFLSEPTVNLVHHETLVPKGATFEARKEPGREETEFIRSEDLWFRPIHARVGPDGALYLVDFYNQAAIHNDTRGPAHGARGAATRPDRDHHFARIYRVHHKEARALTVPNLARGGSAVWTEAITHANGWVRMTAHRLLSEQGGGTGQGDLAALVRRSGESYGRIHALWILENSGQLDPTLLDSALADRDPVVVKNALRILAQRSQNDSREARQAAMRALQHPEPRVRMQALLALATFPTSSELAESVVAVWPSLGDPWLQSAAVGLAAQSPLPFLEASLQRAERVSDLEPFVRQVARQTALRGNVAEAARMVIRIASSTAEVDPLKQAVLEALGADLKSDGIPDWNAELQKAFQSLLASAHPGIPGAALPLIGKWDQKSSLRRDVSSLVNGLAGRLGDPSISETVRAQMAVNLVGVRQMDDTIVPTVAALLGGNYSPEFQGRVAEALGATSDPAAGQALLDAFNRVPSALRDPVLAQLLKRGDWTRLLIEALASQKVAWTTLGPANVHRLRTYSDPDLARRANEVMDALQGPALKEKNAILAQLTPAVEQTGSAEKGHEVFTANCANCHVFKNEGRNLAPNLTGMGAHGPAELLIHIVDPNRLVEPNFLSYSIETKDGEVYDGMIERENNREVFLRNASGDYSIQRPNIQSRRATGLSLMPEGFEALGAEGLRDLLTYLCAEENHYRFLDLRSVFSADNTKGIYDRADSASESLVFKEFGVVKVDEVPFQIYHPSKTQNGNNVVVLKSRNGMARRYPQSVKVEGLNLKASRLHFLGAVGGWAWPFGGEERKGLPVARITITHANGDTQSWTLLNGVDVADYNGRVQVPGSKPAAQLLQHGQVRLFAKAVQSASPITRLQIESFDNLVAPTFVAITAELGEGGTAQDDPAVPDAGRTASAK